MTTHPIPFQSQIAFFISLACAGVIVCYPMFDYDVYWHLANGREMLAHGQIVNEEIFSYTKAGAPFSNHEWLSQIILYCVYQIGGGVGLNVLKIVMTLLTTSVVFSTCRVLGARPFVSCVVAIAAVLVAVNRFNVRPELFSLLGVALLGFILLGFSAGKLSKRALYFIPCIMVVWDWCHGAVYGAVYLTTIAFVENIKPRLASHLRHELAASGMTTAQRRQLNIWLAITAVAMLINPYGLLSYDIFIEFLRDNPLAGYAKEFQPPTWKWNAAFFVFLSVIVLTCSTNWKRLNLTHVALVLPFAILALRYERATAVFALVTAPILAVLLTRPVADSNALTFGMRLRNAVLALLVVGLVCDVGYIKFIKHSQLAFGIDVIEDGLPVGTARFIQDVDLHGNMYNSGHLGGYLAFALAPERKIFQYNHHTVFRDTLYYLNNPSELNRWNINYAVVGFAEEAQRLFPGTSWAPLYHENGASLFVRRSAENAALVQSYETFYFIPYRYTFDDFRAMARDARIYPRLTQEIATYLAYRHDPRVMSLFTELVLQGKQQLSASFQAELVARALRFNAGDDNLRLLQTELQNAPAAQ